MRAIGDIKHCPGCDRDLPLTAFGRKKSCPDGLQVYCKKCHNKEVRESAAIPEHKQGKQARILENRKDPEWYARELEGRKRWYQNHRDDAGFRERQMEQSRKWRATSSGNELSKAASRRWKRKSRKHLRAYDNEYFLKRYANDPEFRQARAEQALKRESAKRANGGEFKMEDWQTLVELAHGKCPACGKRRKLNMDHIVPVVKGGTNYLYNLQPLCRSCNSQKMTDTHDYRTPAMLQWLDLVTS